MADVEFNAIIRVEGGVYWAEVRELPGCFASGETLDELMEALSEAIGMCLSPEDLERLGKPEHAVPSALTVAYS